MADPYIDRYPRVDEVILTEIRRGDGKDHSDPLRMVTQVHAKDGTFIAEYDCVVNMECMKSRLKRAEALLVKARDELRDGDTKGRIDDYFDPEPLA